MGGNAISSSSHTTTNRFTHCKKKKEKSRFYFSECRIHRGSPFPITQLFFSFLFNSNNTYTHGRLIPAEEVSQQIVSSNKAGSVQQKRSLLVWPFSKLCARIKE